MRQIKFRGKRLDNGEWIYGDLYHTNELTCICDWSIKPHTVENFAVDPATVGQFTGLFDKSGNEIYEGDIINWLMHRMDHTGYIEEGRVEFRVDEQAVVVINKFATRDGRDSVRNILNCLRELRVFGNIHDNPELLKAE